MVNCPYCDKSFIAWRNVRGHIPRMCKSATGEYYISLIYGPIHYTYFYNKDAKVIRLEYPELESLKSIKDSFAKRNIAIGNLKPSYTDEKLLEYIVEFHQINNRIPQKREFEALSKEGKSPCTAVYSTRFGSWNKAIELASLTADYNDGFGNKTKGLDGHIYRSKAEAYFCDNFLYNKYDYLIEPKYDNEYKFYDWYIPALDLYIELDGSLRPDTIKDKIQINQQLNKNLLIIPVDSIYSKQQLQDFY